jgi:DME family drug/metabolite transporter
MRLDPRGVALILAAATMWGLIGLFAKLLLARGLSAMEIGFWRAAIAWFFFAAHAAILARMRLRRRDVPAVMVFGVVCVGVFFGAYQVAIRELGVAMAVVLLYTAPAWVALLSPLLLGEAMTRVKALCVALTVAGAATMSLGPALAAGGRPELNLLGFAAGLISGLSYALYYVFGKRFLRHVPTETLFIYALPIGALFLLPTVDFVAKAPGTWLLIVMMAAVSSYGAVTAYYAGLARLEATPAAVLATFEPVVAGLVGLLVFAEHLGRWGWLGAAMILAAVTITARGGAAVESPATRH